jgi:TRAP-type transport system small permease protein
MLERVAKYVNRLMLPVSRVCSTIGMVTMVLLTLVIVIAVCARRFFDVPIRGLHDISVLAFSMMVFLPMAWCTINDAHISMDVIVVKFPKPLRNIVAAITLFLTTATLVVFTWQLLVYALRLQSMGQTASILPIPIFPFLYLATLGVLLMTIIFLMKFLSSLDPLLRRK